MRYYAYTLNAKKRSPMKPLSNFFFENMNMEDMVQQKLRLFFKDESIVFDKSRYAGGLTNYNYIMKVHGKEYVIRKPGNLTDQMIDRKIERVNNGIASEFGVNSECVYFDEESGIKISRYIPDSKTLAAADPFALQSLRAVSSLLKKIHGSPKHFPNTFDWLSELAKYESIVMRMNGELFFDYASLKEQLLRFMQDYLKDVISVPCHNDTVPENFLADSSGSVYLIDWEYSGMNDPAFDIAAYIIESRLTSEAINQLFEAYYGNAFTKNDLMKVKCYMMAQDLLWTVWALLRHYTGDDYLDYCWLRYNRLRRNIQVLSMRPDYPIADMVTA